MKIAVLFSFVVLLFVAFLKPASGCDCVKFLTNAKEATTLLKQLPKNTLPDGDIMKKGPKAICDGLSLDTINLIHGASC